MPLHRIVCLCIGGILALPFFQKKEKLMIKTIPIEKFERTNAATIIWENTSAYNHYRVEGNAFGGTSGKEINWSYFWKWASQYVKWNFWGWNPQTEEWQTHYQGIPIKGNYGFINKTYNWDDNESANTSSKITIAINPPFTTRYRFGLAVDGRIKDYVNRSGQYEYILNVNINATNETYQVVFNWSDIAQYIQNGFIMVKHGFKTRNNQEFFYFIIETVNPLNQGQWYELDPTFGKTTDGANNRDCDNKILGSSFICPSDGTADNITVRFRRKGAAADMKCAIYNNDTLALVGQTDEQNIALMADIDWVTFDFSVNPAVTSGTDYLLVVWSEDVALTCNVRYVPVGGSYELEDVMVYNGFPDPVIEDITNAWNVSIYCSYTEGVGRSWQPLPPATDGSNEGSPWNVSFGNDTTYQYTYSWNNSFSNRTVNFEQMYSWNVSYGNDTNIEQNFTWNISFGNATYPQQTSIWDVSFGNDTTYHQNYTWNISFGNRTVNWRQIPAGLWNISFGNDTNPMQAYTWDVSFGNDTHFNQEYAWNVSFGNRSERVFNQTYTWNVSFGNATYPRQIFTWNISFSNRTEQAWRQTYSWNVSFGNDTTTVQQFTWNISFSNRTELNATYIIIVEDEVSYLPFLAFGILAIIPFTYYFYRKKEDEY